jgi:hypothetical protein
LTDSSASLSVGRWRALEFDAPSFAKTLARPERADANVRAWASATPSEFHSISVVTVLELEREILLVERRDAKQGAVLRRWLEREILVPFAALVCIFLIRGRNATL